jgi:hypothetical protein
VAVDGDSGAIVCYDKMSSTTQDRVFCMRVKVDIVAAAVLKSDDIDSAVIARTDDGFHVAGKTPVLVAKSVVKPHK